MEQVWLTLEQEILKGHVSLGSLRIRQDFMIAQALTMHLMQTVKQTMFHVSYGACTDTATIGSRNKVR